MIAKCLLVLVVVSQISAFRYNQDSFGKSGSSAKNTFEYSYPSVVGKENYERSPAPKSENATPNQSSQSQNSGYKSSSLNGTPARNVVAKGKYSVTLQNCGPMLEKKIPVYTSHIRTPVQEKPTVRLPAKIPAPKTIAHSCTCIKTILKPRVQQTFITVPTIQRYIETTHKPIVENIHYEAFPLKCAESSNTETQTGEEETQSGQNVQFSTIEVPQSQGSPVQTVKIPSTIELPRGQTFDFASLNTEEKSSKAPKTQVVEIPRVQFIEAQNAQSVEFPHIQFVESQKRQENVEIPRVQFVEAQKPQTIEIPRIQFVEAQKPQTVEMSRIQLVEAQKPQTVEMPCLKFVEAQKAQPTRVQFVEVQKPQTVEIPQLQFVEAQKTQNIEMPRIQFVEAQKSQTVEMPRVQFIEAEKFQTVEIPRAQEQETSKSEFSQQEGTLSFASNPFSYSFNK